MKTSSTLRKLCYKLRIAYIIDMQIFHKKIKKQELLKEWEKKRDDSLTYGISVHKKLEKQSALNEER